MKDKEITVTADELQKQKLYTADVAAIMQVRAMHGTPKALVRTYGCQQNVADGERIKGMLSEMGFEFTEDEDEADFILFNTCAIREHAEDRVFGNIGALKNVKRRNPSLLIAVCGCMMEQERVAERIKASFPFVNIVFGTHVIHRLPEMMYTAVTDSKRVFLRGHESKEIIEGLPVRRDGNTRAWVTVMYGCDNFCSYCIVPYVRGRERSRASARIIEEARELKAEGVKEIMLLGQNVNSYRAGEVGFPELIRRVADVSPLLRVRFATSHPKDMSDGLLEVMASMPNVCRAIHLPAQSGATSMLGRMNRKYTREWYLDRIAAIRRYLPDCAITTDLIAGFSGETEEEHLQTLSLMREVGYDFAYMFKYSERPGTFAEKHLGDDVPEEVKSRRLSEIIALQNELGHASNLRDVGREFEVLVEGESKRDRNQLSGRTSQNKVVVFDRGYHRVGDYVRVRITGCTPATLFGDVISGPCN